MSLHVVILAAGLGKRMQSLCPKVLHPIGGQPMLERVVNTALGLQPHTIHVVVGHGASHVQDALPTLPVHWVFQEAQQGTGHAVLQTMPHIPKDSLVLILYADVPLVRLDTLHSMVDHVRQHADLVLLLATVPNPSGLGRIIRNTQHRIESIVEEKDATPAQRAIHEIYSGICCAPAALMQRWLPQLDKNNAQGEYYLTDVIDMAVRDAIPIESFHVDDPMDIQGINDRLQLHQVERTLQQRIATQLMLSGVTLADASRIDVRGTLTCGKDVFIDINAVFTGDVVLGDGCIIGPHCSLSHVTLGANCDIYAHSVLDQVHLGADCHIGPFARLRSGTQLAAGCKIGNFVETKNAVMETNSKASHLSYLGDVTIGKDVNIGAGTITCNYDGANKHQTTIEDGVFIGSDTQLVAPVTIGKNATIGAGSTIRKDVPPDALTLTSSIQKTIVGWQRPRKK